MDESHEGEYSCTPYNALGTEGASPRVRVRVLRPPSLRLRPAPLYLARLGQVLALPCAAAKPHEHSELRWSRVSVPYRPARSATAPAFPDMLTFLL